MRDDALRRTLTDTDLLGESLGSYSKLAEPLSPMRLVNLPTAFPTGFIGSLAYYKCHDWLSEPGGRPRPPIELTIYLTFVFVPFLIFVIGWNRDRWQPDYEWFGEAATAEYLRIALRWGAYWIGLVLASAMR